ncbi:MAG TPA: gamma-glutamylcyclotransferase [Hyphomicrobiaceae bacterium]|nr:gamma-glutamylcyclotransferase [Hyphomicrobiaceae bacterium]
MSTPGGDTWIFAYGSLMWRPGFAFEAAERARLTGYRRCFCIYSMYHRGSPLRPGLVLGLDRGGTCEGIAYRVAADRAAEVRHYLRVREQISGVYREMVLPVELAASRQEVLALAYVVDRAHPIYAGPLPLARQARLIRGARGVSGANLDYLINTLRHLAELGIRERQLERVLALIGPHTARHPRAGQISPYVAGLLETARRQPAGPMRRVKPDRRRRFLYRLRMGGEAWAGGRLLSRQS